jgi:hypothetical protein
MGTIAQPGPVIVSKPEPQVNDRQSARPGACRVVTGHERLELGILARDDDPIWYFTPIFICTLLLYSI